MLNPIICPQCLQPNEPARSVCWKCMRTLSILPSEKDYLRLLNLRPHWSKDDLREAYRRLARKYHPDVNPGNREADAFFKYVNEGYEFLSKFNRETADASTANPAASPARQPDPDFSDELQKKLHDLIRHSRAEKERAVQPEKPSLFKKISNWLTKPR